MGSHPAGHRLPPPRTLIGEPGLADPNRIKIEVDTNLAVSTSPATELQSGNAHLAGEGSVAGGPLFYHWDGSGFGSYSPR